MKNASTYEKKVKKLLSSLGKPPARKAEGDPVRILIQAILAPDATMKQVESAMAGLEREFVDNNELRVSPPKEIVERLKEFPFAREKAEMLVKVLNAVFDKTGTMTMSYMDKMNKRDLRKHLGEIGMSPFSAAYLMLNVFDAHGVCVDRSLLYVLEAEECIYPGSSIEDVQGFLERVIPQKDALSMHVALRKLVEKNSKQIAKRLQAAEAAPPPPAPAPAPAPVQAEPLQEPAIEEAEPLVAAKTKKVGRSPQPAHKKPAPAPARPAAKPKAAVAAKAPAKPAKASRAPRKK